MDNTFTVLVDGQPREITGDQAIKLLFHDGSVKLEASGGAIEISPTTTVGLMDGPLGARLWAIARTTALFLVMWEMVWEDTPMPERVTDANLGMKHTVGMIIQLGAAMAAGKKALLSLPETYLHPKQQVGLGDLFIFLTLGGGELDGD